MATVDALGQYPSAYIYAYVSSTYDASSGTWSSLNCGAEVEKVNILHSTSTNNEQFTILVPGFYRIGASFKIEDSNNGSVRSVSIVAAGTRVSWEDYEALEPGDQHHELNFVAHLKFNAGDIVTCNLYHDNGSNREIEAGATSSYLKLLKLR